MANQYSYHLALKHQAVHSIAGRDETKNNNYLNMNSFNPIKNIINYYYDYIHSKHFDVKNSAYYNQLTRSANFLNSEVSNNWIHDIHTLASINNLNVHHLVSTFPVIFTTRQSLLNNWNINCINDNSISNLFELSKLHPKLGFTTDDFLDSKSETIKKLIALNNSKNEEIIEKNLNKSFQNNILFDNENLKLKSVTHNSLHYAPISPIKTEEPEIKKRKIEDETLTSNIEKLDIEELIKDYTSHPNYVFGYGSLINPDSRGRTVDSTKEARVLKVLAKGLERSWNYNCRDVYTAVGVSKVDDKSVTCNGVIIPIDDPINDLPKLDERELHYRRVPLSRENISIIHDSRNQDIKDEDILAPDAIIWVYEIVDTFTPTTDIPISQIYIDCILLGCMKEGGIEFAKQFIENTHGWNTSVWVNDRTSEHFRKNISRCIIQLNEEIIFSIDSLLTNNLCIDVNKRIIPAY